MINTFCVTWALPAVGGSHGRLRGSPLLLGSAPRLQGEDNIDGRTLRYLPEVNLTLKKQEEEARTEAEHEARRQELDRQVQADVLLNLAESRAWRKSAGR